MTRRRDDANEREAVAESDATTAAESTATEAAAPESARARVTEGQAPDHASGDPPPAAAPDSTKPGDDARAGFVSLRSSVNVKLARFEGPLDLLLHLIKRDEIDIYDIPIAHITQQYLAYIELMRSLDLDVAGEFLVMAATLMRIKARMLLPQPTIGEEEDEGDPREELVQRLLEYRQYKEAASTLKQREEERRLLFQRGMVPGEDEAGPLPLAPATLFDLLDALNRVLARVPDQTVYSIEAEAYDVEDKMEWITKALAEYGTLSFTELMMRCRARSEIVVTFIALLELVKLGAARVFQTENFGDITIAPGSGVANVAAISEES